MIVYDVATKVLGTEEFLQHNIAELNSGITYIVLFSQEKPLRWKEINTHHTHTHTHTHTHMFGLKFAPLKLFPILPIICPKLFV